MVPILSIIIPTYRRADKLARALGSVAGAVGAHSQEVIVLDDCPDGSAFAVARQFGARYVHKAGVDRGQSFSRNIGLSLARGRWVAFLDDDDFLLAGGLERLLNAAQHGDGLLFGDYQAFTASARTEVSLAAVQLDVLLVCNQIPIGAFVIARSAVQRPFDTRMRSHEDWDFLLSNIASTGLRHVAGGVVAIDKTENQTTSTEARRRQLFWLDFLSVYARFPAAHLGAQRQAMLASLGVQLPPGLLDIGDVI